MYFVRIEPSAALFWALGILLAHILKQLTHTVPKAESNFFPTKEMYSNYQNHNRKEIVPFFLHLATKETFPSCPNAPLL